MESVEARRRATARLDANSPQRPFAEASQFSPTSSPVPGGVAVVEAPAKPYSVRRKWYYKTLGEVSGPVSSRRLWKLAQRQDVGPETFVRKGRKGDWVLAEKVHGLFDPHFGDRFADHHHDDHEHGEGAADEAETHEVEGADEFEDEAAPKPEDESAARDAVHLIRFREEVDLLRRRIDRRVGGVHLAIALVGSVLTVFGVLGLATGAVAPWSLLAIEPAVRTVVAAVITGAGLTMSTVGVLLIAGVLRDS